MALGAKAKGRYHGVVYVAFYWQQEAGNRTTYTMKPSKRPQQSIAYKVYVNALKSTQKLTRSWSKCGEELDHSLRLCFSGHKLAAFSFTLGPLLEAFELLPKSGG